MMTVKAMGFRLIGFRGLIAERCNLPVRRLKESETQVVGELTDCRTSVIYEPASTPEEFASFIRTEIVKLGKVVKFSGAKLD